MKLRKNKDKDEGSNGKSESKTNNTGGVRSFLTKSKESNTARSSQSKS